MSETYNPEKWTNIRKTIFEMFRRIIENTKKPLDKLEVDTTISSDLSWLKKESEWSESKLNEVGRLDSLKATSNKDNGSSKENSTSDSKQKNKKLKDNKEASTEHLNAEKLKSFFEKNATNLSLDKIDGKDFFEVFYTDKNSGSKVKGIIPVKWDWDSNIYMPGDRSGIEETMKQKKFKENITDKNSKKARFIFEGDADKINWNQKSARYNRVIKNFESMISPMKLTGSNPKITIIWHSRAGATVNKLIWSSWSINNFIILDWTYWVYRNVMQSKIPGKIFYTNGGGTVKYISNYKNKPNIEVIWDYAKLGHEAVVPKALFDTPSTKQDLFG